MKNLNWKDVAELVGIAAIVISLVFVGVQLQQERMLSQQQILADQDDTQIEWARLINDNSTLWVKGLSGEELTVSETARFAALSNAYFSKRSYVFQRFMLRGRVDPNIIASGTANVIVSYPGLGTRWKIRVTRLRSVGPEPPFERAVERYLREIEEGTRQPTQHDDYAPM